MGPQLNESYQTALQGRLKAYDIVKKIRKSEKKGNYPPVPALRDPDVWSDTSSCASIFKGPGTNLLLDSKIELRRKDGVMAPIVKPVYDRIGALLEEPKVKEACKNKPQKGSKYDSFGGINQTSDRFKRQSLEDPWDYPTA